MSNTKDKKVEVQLQKIYPCFNLKAEPTPPCGICRNELDEVCNFCRNSNQDDPKLCPIVTGKCGHKFHKHCIEMYVKKSGDGYFCPYIDCNARWETV